MHGAEAEGQGTTSGRLHEPPTTGKELVRQVIEQVWHQGNLAYIRVAFSPGFVGSGPTGGFRDLSNYRLHVGEVRAAFPDIRFDIVEQVEERDLVVTHYRMRGTHLGEFMGVRPTTRRVTLDGIAIHRVERGRIVEAWSCWDVMGLLREVGVPVPTPPLRALATA